MTAHRRENHGKRLESIIEAISTLAIKFSDCIFIIPLHPNPNVYNKVKQKLSGVENILLMDSLPYPHLVYIMQKADLILTDSGGIQEEAPSFGTPLLVLRYETERKEGIEARFAKLVGADKEKIIKEASEILENNIRINAKNPYGDGKSSEKIAQIIKEFFNGKYAY
ncbi:MAG: UDP-N-acetylglucosamine 2-epimerase [Helicobacteraceae bacterium]|nr:UDP-N-acetylglucosamine 2-epimerase [Helicobacteraceae bacterium]